MAGAALVTQTALRYSRWVKIDRHHETPRKPNTYWRGARLAARVLAKSSSGKALVARDRLVARALFQDEGISNRLIDQAAACLRANRKF
jgi:hypothetical protein